MTKQNNSAKDIPQTSTLSNKEKDQAKDKINYDYDWNTEYGDGDIPEIDK